MSTLESIAADAIYHPAHLDDRAAMRALRAAIAAHPTADLGPEGRAAFDELIGRTPPAEGVTHAAGTLGGVSGWWCRPANHRAGTAILYLHGGAYGLGSARAYRNFAGQIAARAQVAAFVADYALAPERPFPAAVEDAEAAYRALADSGMARIGIVGDSAGGGLALVTAARMSSATRAGGVRPAAVVAMSPWTDLALTGQSYATRAQHDPLLTREALDHARRRYLVEADVKDERASPLYGDVADLPPVLLHVGEDEILLDDARRFAQRLKHAGSLGELHVWQDMVHVFPANVALLHAARAALDNIGEFLRHNLGSHSPATCVTCTHGDPQ